METSEITRLASYKKLKTELEICKIGGLFLALSQDEHTTDTIIKRLESDLSKQFVFSLEMTPQKVGFPTFFEQSFEQTGKRSNIFHVLGIEKLPKQLQSNFINYLQYTRERFKAKPYSIVFWVSPQFRKQLFFSAPDFYNWIFGVYDFSEIQIDPEFLEEADLSKSQQVSLGNIPKYLEKVVWQYEHWQEVKDSGEEFLIEVMERVNLHEYYVQTYCIDKNSRKLLLDDLLEEFLADDTRNFLTLLGDFGTGKSSFSLHHFIHLAKRYLQIGEGRIPIFISLKNYPGKINIEDFIVREFYEKFNIELSFSIFQELALQGKFMFFVDGFDEMASLSDQKLTEENFKELTKLSFENILFMTNSSERSQKANKVFLTCRTHYFFTEVQEKKILKSSYTVLYRDYASKTNYEITRIKLKGFNNKQIKEYVFKNTRDKKTTQNILGIIKDTYNLQELSTRPILLDMIVKTLPSLEDKKEINAANLYKAYTELWINRDDWRSQMKPEGKRAFMWELALKMFINSGDFSLHYSALDKPKVEYLKQNFQCEEGDGDYYKYETTTCTFLNRDTAGNYKFIHKSFMEYFLAEHYFYRIRTRKKRILESSQLNKETEFFLKLLISSNKFDLKNIDLSGLNLQGTRLKKIDFVKANLENTNLKGTDLSGANLSGANLSGANLSGVKLAHTSLRGADLRKADLRYTDFSGRDFRGKDLKGADFRGADFREADLRKAILEGTDLSGANFSNMYLRNRNFTGTILSEANFTGTDLTGSKLIRTNFNRAILCDANFRNADLSYADLSHADLSHADFVSADLNHVDLRHADLSHTDFRYADLQGANLNHTLHRDSANFDYAIFDEDKKDKITNNNQDNGQEEQS